MTYVDLKGAVRGGQRTTACDARSLKPVEDSALHRDAPTLYQKADALVPGYQC